MDADNSSKISVNVSKQRLYYHEDGCPTYEYVISTAKNGEGSEKGSFCTPLGVHKIACKIGADLPLHSIFVRRRWTGAIYHPEEDNNNDKDWILTRILWLKGLEPLKNQGGKQDSLRRFIYIHGTNDIAHLGQKASCGCIRMDNHDIIELFEKVSVGVKVNIHV
jgi:L,D-transpeptidase YbiS